jgi:hypothetical protein
MRERLVGILIDSIMSARTRLMEEQREKCFTLIVFTLLLREAVEQSKSRYMGEDRGASQCNSTDPQPDPDVS